MLSADELDVVGDSKRHDADVDAVLVVNVLPMRDHFFA